MRLVGYVVVFNLVLSGGEKNGNYRYSLRSWYHGGSSCIFLVDGQGNVCRQVSSTMQTNKKPASAGFLLVC